MKYARFCDSITTSTLSKMPLKPASTSVSLKYQLNFDTYITTKSYGMKFYSLLRYNRVP